MRCIDKAGVENKDRDITAEILDRAVNRQLTHRLDVVYTVLNEIVVDRGPNASMYPLHTHTIALTSADFHCQQPCPPQSFMAMICISQLSRQTVYVLLLQLDLLRTTLLLGDLFVIQRFQRCS
jgi:hypothetical protein